MANMPQPAYQGKQLTPGMFIKASQGLATAAVAANLVHPANAPPSPPVDQLVPRHPNDLSNPNCC